MNSKADLSQLDPTVKNRIETAALQVFADNAYQSVGMGDVARAANASLQTLYKYYGSKEALLFACLDNLLGQMAQHMMEHLQGIQTYKDRLRKVFWVVLDFSEKHPQLHQVLMNSVYFNSWREDPSFTQPELSRMLINVISEGRSQGILTEELSEPIILDFFYGILFRLVWMQQIRGRKESLTQQADILFERLWLAIAKNPSN